MDFEHVPGGAEYQGIPGIVLDDIFFSVWQVLEDFAKRAREKFPNLDLGPMGEPDLLLKLAMDAWDNPEVDGSKSAESVAGWLEGSRDHESAPLFFHVIDTVIAYSTQALKCDESGDTQIAWQYLGKARYWEGILNSIYWLSPLFWKAKESPGGTPNPAAQMAMKRHAGSAAEKQRILDYWGSNLDPGMSASKAATHIVTTGKFSLEYRTIQTLISAAKKQRRQ